MERVEWMARQRAVRWNAGVRRTGAVAIFGGCAAVAVTAPFMPRCIIADTIHNVDTFTPYDIKLLQLVTTTAMTAFARVLVQCSAFVQ